MVQRKVANKSGIKPLLHKLDTQLVNLKPSSLTSSSSTPSTLSSSQAHDKLKKIMKKSRSIKHADESRSLAPFKTKKTPPSTPKKQLEHLQRIPFQTPTKTPNASPFKRSPNYMKSTSSFEARKEQSPSSKTTPIKKVSKTNESSSSGIKGSRTSSLKVRSLTKTSSFKPLRSSKKVIICEDVDSQRATCSSTLKDSKFPDYLRLNDGGTELDGTSAMKVCPYTYCSLNGHHHAPVPPLKCFLSARRRALKTQKGFKLGCLSPRQNKASVKKSAVKEPAIVTPKEVDMEDEDFFIDIYSAQRVPLLADMKGKDASIKTKRAVKKSAVREPIIATPEEVDMESNDIFNDIYSDDKEQPLVEMQGKDVCIRPELDGPHTCESLVRQVCSDDKENKGAQDSECSDIEWEEGYRSDSGTDALREKTGVEKLYNDHQELYDEESVSSGAWSEEDCDSASDSSCQHFKINQDYMNYDESEVSSTTSESDINDKMGQHINYQQEQTSQESKTVPDFAENSNNEADKNRTTIIYNIIQFNISVFINGEKTEHSVQVPATSVAADKMETDEPMEEQEASREHEEASEVNHMAADEELPFDVQDHASDEQLDVIEKQDNPEQECNEYEAASTSDEIISETDVKTDSSGKTSASVDKQPDPCVNLRDLTGVKKPCEETGDDSREFNPRGPNFLPETPDPDAETVDLRHQTIDERKNAEEFMVDFALQQAVTTLAPARKKKVALLVEAFEKVMPDQAPVRPQVHIPGYEPQNRHTSKAFTNSRPMQACS
ncbi:putative calcium/calmodulin-dependent protein kinase [Helianthus annuus]|nr:putative calcium/calmodulin-dependent protein kinase [Helianthus annuus]